jgi:hypothetical protein
MVSFNIVTSGYDRVMYGMKFTHGGHTGNVFASTPNELYMRNCELALSNGAGLCAGDNIDLHMYSCRVDGDSANCMNCGDLRAYDTVFATSITSGTFCAVATDGEMDLFGCRFISPNASTHTWLGITATWTGRVTAVGNTFKDSSGGAFTAFNLGTLNGQHIKESNNVIEGAGLLNLLYAFTVTSSANCDLGTRRGRVLNYTENATPYDPPAKLFGVVRLTRDVAGGQAIRMNQAASLSHDGARFTLVISNVTGAGIAITGSGFTGDAASKSFTLGANSTRSITFIMSGTTWFVESVVTADMT